jgi:hypothetical protein
MIDIGKNTIFISDESTSTFISISKIIKFYELIGKNQVFFHKENSKLHHYINVKKVLFKNDLSDRIFENLFQADLIVIEDNSIHSLAKIRKITDIPLIIIQSLSNYKILSNFTKIDKIYKFSVNSSKSDISEENYLISDINSGWSSDLLSLRLKYTRDLKITEIFKSN